MKIVLDNYKMKHGEISGGRMTIDILDESGVEVTIILADQARDYVHQATSRVRPADVTEMHRATKGIAGGRPRGSGKSA